MIVLTVLIVSVAILDMYGFDVLGYLDQVERERGPIAAFAEALRILNL